MADSRYVLAEFPIQVTEQEAERTLRELTGCGYRPIIAHIERYRRIRGLETARQFIRMGAYIQVNAGSLLGAEGWGAKLASGKLLRENAVHFVGSDAHSAGRRKPRLGECAVYMTEKIGEEGTRRILIENPEKIIKNEYI